jgi:hypothetical protein
VAVSLLMEETIGPGENHRPVASDRKALSHNVSSKRIVFFIKYSMKNYFGYVPLEIYM